MQWDASSDNPFEIIRKEMEKNVIFILSLDRVLVL